MNKELNGLSLLNKQLEIVNRSMDKLLNPKTKQELDTIYINDSDKLKFEVDKDFDNIKLYFNNTIIDMGYDYLINNMSITVNIADYLNQLILDYGLSKDR